ncbi:unnamed protein product [Zymoseptoria tritici ST99CH_3D7]|uniref:FAD-binding FR-type domain-containing protein n=1 Tax=Zymoseptoria tritici (strain ST99CH_3D7) TaxID=1276538 RepID=A0A1X7RE34_ZYMT9|nr:unnamed protein product [Zymoseptoria tritici ST99CH_3D7]
MAGRAGLVALLLLSSSPSSRAHTLPYVQESEYCAVSCAAVIGRVTFNGSKPENPPCSSNIAVTSLFACTSKYCATPDEAQYGLGYINWTCSREGKPSLPEYYAIQLPSPDHISTVSAAQIKKVHYNQTVVPTEDYYRLVYRSTDAKYKASYYDWMFVFAIYGYWILVLLIGVLFNIVSSSKAATSAISKSSLWKRAYRLLILPRMGSDSLGGHCTFNALSRLVTLPLIIHAVLCFVLLFPAYDTAPGPGDFYYGTVKIERGKYVANRIGTFTAAHVPIVWIFAARNNPFQWFTGWSYATFSQYHRWLARTMTLLAVSHGVSYSVVDWYKNTYLTVWDDLYWRCGVLSVITICTLFVIALPWVRSRSYEVFLVFHIALAAVLLAGLYYHWNELTERRAYHGFLWPAVAMWSLDRFLRFSRLMYLNIRPMLSNGVMALVSRDQESELVRVDVTDFFSTQTTTSTPGQYYFVYEIGPWQGYQSHPFTLCSWISDADSSALRKEADETKSPGFEVIDEVAKDASQTGAKAREVRHTFLIRPRQGFTQRLLSRAFSASNNEDKERQKLTRRARFLLEGPYGQVQYSPRHSSILLLVGGSGISAMISRLHILLDSFDDAEKSVHLVWSVRMKGTADDVCAHELSSIVGRPGFRLTVHLTTGSENEKVDETSAHALYELRKGRPDVKAVIENERAKCSDELTVFCCGPQSLELDCRKTVQSVLHEDGADVSFCSEQFGW